MISATITDFSISKFKLLPIDGGTDLSNADTIYEMCPANGGIEVKLKIDLGELKDGFIILSQICVYHKLLIATVDQTLDLELKTPHRDSKLPSNSYYETFKVINGSFQQGYYSNADTNEVIFFDVLYTELLKEWISCEYDINFDVYLMFAEANNLDKIIPVLKFSWSAGAIAAKEDGDWNLVFEKHSSNKEFIDSVLTYKEADQLPVEILKPDIYPHLASAVREHRKNIGFIKK